MLCPTYRPLMPAKILMVLVLQMPRRVMQTRKRWPRSRVRPKRWEKGEISVMCVGPWQTDTRGSIIKKGKRSLQRQGSSSISSAKPRRMVASTVIMVARCVISAYQFAYRTSSGVRTKPTMQKATAAANPMHSGIFFYPASLPRLLMSSPNTPCRSINSLTFGMRDTVMAHAARAERAVRRRGGMGSWGRREAVARAARVRVNVY